MTGIARSSAARWFSERLHPDAGPCYALIDAARDARLHRLLRHDDVQALSLFSDVPALRLSRYGAYCAKFPLQGELATQWFANGGQGWSDAWGWLFQSHAGLDALKRHFKKFLMVQMPQGGDAYWRFYDPRVLCEVLPVMRMDQHDEFVARIVRRIYCVDPATQRLLEVWPQESTLGSLLGNRPLSVRVHELPSFV